MKDLIFWVSIFWIITLPNTLLSQNTQETRYVSSIEFDNVANWSGHSGAIGDGNNNGSCTSGARNSGTVWAEFSFGSFNNLVGQVVGIEICPKYSSGAGSLPLQLKYDGTVVASRTIPQRSGSNCNSTGLICLGGSTDDWSAGLFAEDFNSGEVIVRIELGYSNANINLDHMSMTVYTDGEEYSPDCSSATIENKSANGSCKATISGDDVLGVIDLDSRPTITVNPTSLTLGDNTVTINATDAENNSCSTQITVTVVDNTKPTISCPGNQTVNTDAGSCDAMITIGTPTVSDNCAVVSLTNDFNGQFDASDIYPEGQTIITWTALDAAGNQRSCTHKITVRDRESPTVNCNDTTVASDDGSCEATLVLLPPTISDNCEISSVINDFTTHIDSPAVFYPGENIVTWTIKDASNNETTCTQTVTVVPGTGCIICEDPDFENSYSDVNQSTGDHAIESTMEHSIWQSFVPNSNGALAFIDAWFGDDAISQFHGGYLHFYRDEGIDSDLLFSMVVGETSGQARIDVTDLDLLLLTCHTYTLEFVDTVQSFIWHGSFNNPYPYGRSSFDSLTDQQFAIQMAACSDIRYGVTTKTWTADVDSFWNNPLNWDPIGVPTSGDAVRLENNTIPGPFIKNNTSARANSIYLDNFTSLYIDTLAKLFIEGSTANAGIHNNVGTVHNYGSIYMGKALPLSNIGIYNLGTLNNFGTLEIYNALIGIYGVTNNANFHNFGNAIISNAGQGITIEGGYVNNFQQGTIQIDDILQNAIHISGARRITNEGTIEIGHAAVIGGNGLYLRSLFFNESAATLSINQVQNNAIHIESGGSFKNSGTISTGDLHSIQEDGIYCSFGQFTNHQDAHVFLQNIQGRAIYSFSEFFDNYGVISIGYAGATMGQYFTLHNRFNFTNHPCAYLQILSDNGIRSDLFPNFVNNGIIIEHASDSSIIQYNNGLIRNLNGGVFAIDSANTGQLITNTDPLWAPACQDLTIPLNEDGYAILLPESIDNGSIDLDTCARLTFTLSQDTFDCNDIGTQSVTLTIIDNLENQLSCVSNVTVIDTIGPTASCIGSSSVYLDEEGVASLVPITLDRGSMDNCEISSMEVDISSFTCDNIGLNHVVFKVADPSNNRDSCTVEVIVVDTISPTVICKNIVVELDTLGFATITGDQVNQESRDNCTLQSLNLDKSTFSCNDLGEQQVMLTVLDINGNEGLCNATVTVSENTASYGCELTCDDCENLIQNSWVGGSDKFWNNAENWSHGTIPTICHQVIISSDSVIIQAGNSANCYLLDQSSESVLEVEPGGTLIVGECISN